jgi:hypothetical protein
LGTDYFMRGAHAWCRGGGKGVMDERLQRRIVDAICEEWERTEGALDSMVVYDRLIGEGENFPLSEMEELMYELWWPGA